MFPLLGNNIFDFENFDEEVESLPALDSLLNTNRNLRRSLDQDLNQRLESQRIDNTNLLDRLDGIRNSVNQRPMRARTFWNSDSNQPRNRGMLLYLF